MTDILAYSRLEPDAFDPAHELDLFLSSAAGDGAIVSFVGLTRSQENQVDALILNHHPVLTAQSLRQIAEDARMKFNVSRTWVVHRCGTVGVNRPIVFAAASAPHRRSAFAAADYLMDRLKTDAVFWKKEEGAGGSRWIEPTSDDYNAHLRWRE